MKEADVTHHTHTATASTPTDRLVDALNDPARLFEPVQVAHLMATAMRWGYELAAEEMAADPLSHRAGFDAGYQLALAEQEQGYPPPPFLIAQGVRIAGDRAAVRAAVQADRTERYSGGPVEVWEADRPDFVAPHVSVSVVKRRHGYEWADA